VTVVIEIYEVEVVVVREWVGVVVDVWLGIAFVFGEEVFYFGEGEAVVILVRDAAKFVTLVNRCFAPRRERRRCSLFIALATIVRTPS